MAISATLLDQILRPILRPILILLDEADTRAVRL